MLVGLHEVYALAGRPSYRNMARGIKGDDRAPATLNYQAIGKILTGKTIPSPRQLVSLATWLFGEGSASGRDVGDVDGTLAQLLQLREDAHRHYIGSHVDPETSSSGEERRGTPNGSSLVNQGVASERKMLSCMLQSKDAIADVVELVAPADFVFAGGLHLGIYVALLKLYVDEADITAGAVARIVESDTPTSTNVDSYVADLFLEATDPREAEAHAERVVELAKLRRVESMGVKFAQLAQDASVSDEGPGVDALVTNVENEVISFMNDMTQISGVSAVLEDALNEADAVGEAGADPASVRSGFSVLDSLTSGFRPGELIVVGGASGVGKSTLGLDFIRACSISQSRTSYLATLQMSRKEMAMRMMAAEGRVSLAKMRSGTMNDDEWTRLARIMPSVDGAPIWMQDAATYTLAELVQSCRRLSFFNDLQLVVIDSLDLLYVDRRSISADLESDLGVTGRELRNLAKELNIPVVALLHTDPPSYDHTGYRRPALRDIPGSLERLADVVILIHRDEVYEKESLRAGESDLIVAKNRSGPTGTVTVAFQGHYARFGDMSR
ncbi:DnaB-like helicase C-terminal domain-containing protein [Streptomyces sp. NPDC054837]